MLREANNKKFSNPKGKLYINREWKDSQNGRTFQTISASTEEEVIKIAEASDDDVNLAIQAVRNSFDNGPWPLPMQAILVVNCRR